MAEIPYYRRTRSVTTLDDADLLIINDPTSDVGKQITFSDFATDISSSISTSGVPYAEKTSNYTLTSSDYTINCTSGTFTITLPTAVGITGRCFEVTNTGNGVITLDTTSSETIQGDLTQKIYQDECFVVRSTGVNWIVI